MKKALLLSIALVLAGLNSFAQSEMLNPVQIGHRLSAVNFIDANTGFAAGDGGTILKTSNGGTTWISQPSGTTYDLYAASFPGENTYYAAGAVGLVVKTSDGGTTWQNFTPGSTAGISSAFFIDSDTGFVTNGNDGTAVKTTDGGATWNQCLETGQVLYSVYFLDANTGYVSGINGIILKTTDGGTTWNNQVSGTTEILFSIYFFDENSGYAVGLNGTIIHTSDGGATWVGQASGITQRLMCVRFTDVNTGYAVGDYGQILRTDNGGSMWSTLPSGTTIDLYSICFIGADTAYTVGGYWNSGIILNTIDGGDTWTNQSNVLSRCINIPSDYTTIQQGIDAANNGDTVLVQPGTYLENLNFNGKRIIVASLFLTTQDDAYISQTVIDGNAGGSVVRFENGEDSTAVLCGFTLTNGHSWAGGGIYIYYSSPKLQKLSIKNNFSDNGGGIYCDYYSFPHLKSVTIKNNSAVYSGGGIYCYGAYPVFDSINRCNIFLNNALTGNDLFSSYFTDVIEVVVDTFSVLNPTNSFAFPLSDFSFDILHGKFEQVSADLFVSPGGDDSNSGLTESDPMKTIHYALQIIYADSLNPRTINLLPGTYSPSANGEIFPLVALDDVSLSGESEGDVILDAEGLSRVIYIYNNKNTGFVNLTITGGYADSGGGIYCSGSNPDLQHLSIINNSSLYNGGAICLIYSSPEMQDITIRNNSSTLGGGISCYGESNPHLQNLTIKNNIAVYGGGGIYFSASNPSFDSSNRCNIYLNNAPAGRDLYCESYYTDTINVIVDTFTVSAPKSIHAYPLGNFHFNILHGMLPQENITLYVSPGGDNASTGLTTDDPLKTIQFALSVINADSLNIYTIHLLNGTYSPSSNEEVFPLNIPEYVHLEGESESGVILDAEGLSSVISVNNSAYVEISGLTVTGGNNNYNNGGGMNFYGCNPHIKNVTISNNNALNGGGIFCHTSGPHLENVTISGNTASTCGGGIFFYYSRPVFDSLNRCNIYLNSAATGNDLYTEFYQQVLQVNLDTFTVLIPRSFHAYPLVNFNFDILHGKIPQEYVDIFVSPAGDNANSGLTQDDPMKTIQFALSLISADNLNFYTLHLLDGTYSASSSGEVFPLNIPEFLKVEGESEAGVILDAEGQSRVIEILSSQSVEISGLTITGGNDSGGGMYLSNSSPYLHDLKITGNAGSSGGGIYMENYSSPELQNIIIANNTSQSGGGIYCYYSDPHLENITISNNYAEYSGGGICFLYSSPVLDSINRCNIYFNKAANGNDLYADIYPDVINVIVDTFSVLFPTSFHAFPLQNFNFDLLNGRTVQVEADLYVSPDGDNNNSGLVAGDPLKSIYFAHSKMLADSLHPHTVNLLAGTYSPSTNGESFPVNMLDFVNLSGESESGVILDAEGLSRVIIKNNIQPAVISHLTIKGGHCNDNGGGIYCGNSSLSLHNVSITNNYANYGGGIYCIGSPNMQNVTISCNSANYAGGGIYCDWGSNPALQNVSITNNSAGSGGGIYSYYAAPIFDPINRCNIYLNSAVTGNDLYSDSYQEIMEVVLDTFTVMNPNRFHAWPLENFSFNILHGKIVQVDADLFVSPDGDNDNTGLTAADPLKNINRAYTKILADSQHPHTVNLLSGTYSHSGSGEIFPVHTYEYISLSGESENGVILDAEGQSRVLELNDNHNVQISNMTVIGGSGDGGGILMSSSSPDLRNISIIHNSANSGGGICMNYSSPYLQDVTISNNSAYYNGGGIYCNRSNPTMNNVRILNNSSGYNGGGLSCEYESNPVLQHVDISNNSATHEGGGIYCYYYSNADVQDVTITHNTALTGGGINCYISSFDFDSINRCNIFLNEAMTGSDLYSDTHMNVIVDTFTVLYPKSYHAYPFEKFSFDLLHGKVEQVNVDVYVSPEGNNANTGLTADDAFKTIRYATLIMAEDSQLHNTIHLLNGIYSDSTNGEFFPLVVPKYISLEGESETGVILDAKGRSRVIELSENPNSGLSSMTITGGFSTNDGGGIFCDHSIVSLSDITIKNNSTDRKGGGIYFDHSGGDMHQVTLTDNSALLHGGGISSVNSSLAMQNVTVMNNSAGNSGGGIYYNNSDPVMQNVSLSGNSAGYAGGGIYAGSNSNPVFDRVSMSDNIAGSRGGGFYCSSSDPELKNVIFTHNTATKMGGGIYISNSDPIMLNIMILENYAETGGGIYCSNVESNLLNPVISDNITTDAGGGIYSASSQLKLTNATMAGNQALDGGGIYCFNSALEFRNSILWNESGYEVFFKETSDPSSASFSYSDIHGGESGVMTNNNGTATFTDGNINEDPMFIGTGDYPYAIEALSPCRNEGSPDTTGLQLPATDMAGGPRIWLGRIDIGAYEWNNVGIDESAVGGQRSTVSIYPNPVGTYTTFEYELGEAADVTLRIFNNMSQHVTTLVNEHQGAGTHSIQWNAAGLSAGVYYYHLQAGILEQSGKIMIVK